MDNAQNIDWNGDLFRIKFGRRLRALSKLDNLPNERIDEVATDVFLEAMARKGQASPLLLDEELLMLCKYTLQSFRTCLNYERILNLNIVWYTHMARIAIENPVLEMSYHLAYMHILLNTKQATLFFEYFDKVASIAQDTQSMLLLTALPFEKILNLCILLNDPESLCTVLSAFASADEQIVAVSPEQWMLALSIGIDTNHYGVVKLVYDNHIMREFMKNSSHSEDVAIKAVGSKSDIFWSLSEGTLSRALVTLARAGDIERTMDLIETHFLHKSLRGEKGLTKELCVSIITAYSYHLSKQSLERKDLEPDQGFKVFLEVLSTFVSRFIAGSSELLKYKDISDSFSHMLFYYQSEDRAVNRAVANAEIKRRDQIQLNSNDPHVVGRWEKTGSPANDTSPKGNTVANMETLEQFIAEHIEHIKSTGSHQTEVTSLFVKCLLNHVVIHQNFSGTVKVLQCVDVNFPNFKYDILDNDIFDILLFGLSRSSSAKQCGYILYGYMIEHNIQISSQQYAWFINSQIRGYIHPGVQYFIYEYLKASEGHISKSILDVLMRIPKQMLQEQEGTQHLIQYVRSLHDAGTGVKLEDVENFYASSGLVSSRPETSNDLQTQNSRAYHAIYDERDLKILEHIFN